MCDIDKIGQVGVQEMCEKYRTSWMNLRQPF